MSILALEDIAGSGVHGRHMFIGMETRACVEAFALPTTVAVTPHVSTHTGSCARGTVRGIYPRHAHPVSYTSARSSVHRRMGNCVVMFAADAKDYYSLVHATTVTRASRTFANMSANAQHYLANEPLESQIPALFSGRLDSYTTQSCAEVRDCHGCLTVGVSSTHIDHTRPLPVDSQ